MKRTAVMQRIAFKADLVKANLARSTEVERRRQEAAVGGLTRADLMESISEGVHRAFKPMAGVSSAPGNGARREGDERL